MTGRAISDFVDADDVALLDEQLAQLNAKQVESFSVELRLPPPRRHIVWVAAHGSFFAEPGPARPA